MKTKIPLSYFIILLLLLLALLLGPMDFFSHGYSCNSVQYVDIPEDAFYGKVDLAQENYTFQFTPRKSHFAGFEIFFEDIPQNMTGEVCLSIKDSNEKEIGSYKIAIGDISSYSFYKLKTNVALKPEQSYTLTLSTLNCSSSLLLSLVNSDYLPSETQNGHLLLNYAYSSSTFGFKEKLLLNMLIFAAIIALGALTTLHCTRHRKIAFRISLFLLCTSLLCWNYMFNSMDNENTNFGQFQEDSELLVQSIIHANANGVASNNIGLGIWVDILGAITDPNRNYITNDNYENSYSRTEPAILIASNSYTRAVTVPGNSIRFSDGTTCAISKLVSSENQIIVYLNSENIFSSSVNGPLINATFLDANGNVLPKGKLNIYDSQYGLQGKIFGAIGKLLSSEGAIINLNFLCCFLAAVVFSLIALISAHKIDFEFSVCMFITFWLSPWIVNFAKNLYWVEFTWFIPMLIGLFCSWKYHNRPCRILCYLGTFFSILFKCLCGYEYISTIMLAAIAFLLIDFICAIIEKKTSECKLLLCTIFLMGIFALAGFLVALILHTSIFDADNLLVGINHILKDALRRTTGNLNNAGLVSGREFEALTASTWETICLYFNFPTSIITGIGGNIFPLLCMTPVFVFIYNYATKHVLAHRQIVMYIVFLSATLSWHILAQNHSYVHTHMNYVLWYFGFVQTCFYIIIKQLCKNRE